jgi:hypothetical protein
MARIEGFSFGFHKDLRLVGLLDGALLLLAFAGVLLIMTGSLGGWIVGGCLLGLGLLVVWLVFPTYYRLTERELIIRSGPLRWRIDLRTIVQVEPSHTRPCASAWSFDALRISYTVDGRSQFALVAPRDRHLFVQRLRQAAPQARFDGPAPDACQEP